MKILADNIILSVLAFLTVNSAISLTKILVAGLPWLLTGTRGKTYDTMFAAAESFNCGVIDRTKWRKRLRRLSDEGTLARGTNQPIWNLHTLLMLVFISLIIGAEVLAILALRPRRFELKSSEAQVEMHRIVKAIDRSTPPPLEDSGQCDTIIKRETTESGAFMWKSIACVRSEIADRSLIASEQFRAIASNDTYRFNVIMVAGGDGEKDIDDLVMWAPINSLAHMYSMTYDVRVLPFGAPSSPIFERVPVKLREDILRFSLMRKFGTLCVISENLKLARGAKVLQVSCDRRVGNLSDIWSETVRSGKELFERTRNHTLFLRKTKNNVPVRGERFDPIIQILYGVDVTSWRFLLSCVIVVVAVLINFFRTIFIQGTSVEAMNDLLRRAAFDECDVLPWSGPYLKTTQVLANTGEFHHLELTGCSLVDVPIDEVRVLR